jgi:hypothetical protein
MAQDFPLLHIDLIHLDQGVDHLQSVANLVASSVIDHVFQDSVPIVTLIFQTLSRLPVLHQELRLPPQGDRRQTIPREKKTATRKRTTKSAASLSSDCLRAEMIATVWIPHI